MDNDALINDLLRDFKTINSIKDSSFDLDYIYLWYIRKAVQSILNRTNRYEFPDGLKYLVLDMVSDVYTSNYLSKHGISEDANYVKSLSEEGRSVTFGNASETLLNTLLSRDVNSKLDAQREEINKYKLLYKVKKNDD